MLPIKRYMPVVAGLLVLFSASRADEPRGLSLAEFEKLHKEMRCSREAWQDVPWQLSILEATARAAREKKPVYMLVRSGHPLGCV